MITNTDTVKLLDDNRESLAADVRAKIEAQEKACDEAVNDVLMGGDPEKWQDECTKLEEMVKDALKVESFKVVK
jgi:hypothetical protein